MNDIPDHWKRIDIPSLAHRLALGKARNRSVDSEPRTITISDDEAWFLWDIVHEAIISAPTIEGELN